MTRCSCPKRLYARAVIAETRLIKPEENWQAALDAYRVVADNHKDTALGKLAQKRVEVLGDKQKRDEVLKIYQDLRIEFVREDRLPALPPGINPGQPCATRSARHSQQRQVNRGVKEPRTK